MDDIAKIAAELSEQDRCIVNALCGNAWSWTLFPSPGIRRMEELGFMVSRSLGSRGKSRPTPRGLAVRDYLRSKNDG